MSKLTSDELLLVLEEVLDVSAAWYNLGLQLKVKPGTLDSIQADFSASGHRLREMLKVWLTSDDNPSWKTLTGALRSRAVGASQLAGDLETKYCKGTSTLVLSAHITYKAICTTVVFLVLNRDYIYL